MLFLMGLGYTLMTKQNAIVGARAAVYYQAPREELTSEAEMSAMIKDAVSLDREEWTLEFARDDMQSPDTGKVDTLQAGVSRIYQLFNKEIRYTARGTATLGFLPRIMDLGHAQGTYYLPQGTWTCAQTRGGSYTSIVLGRIGVPYPINGWLGSSCCENYRASYR